MGAIFAIWGILFLSIGIEHVNTDIPSDLPPDSSIDDWTAALQNHDRSQVFSLLMTPYSLSEHAYNQSMRLEALLTPITGYYEEIISNKTYVDHVGAFEKLYTFFADSMFLLPPHETETADKWLEERMSYRVTPVSANAFLSLHAAHENLTLVRKSLSRMQEFVADALPVLHDLGHTASETKKLKELAARFLALTKFGSGHEYCDQATKALLSFFETWEREG